jgi:hypothetical protein
VALNPASSHPLGFQLVLDCLSPSQAPSPPLKEQILQVEDWDALLQFSLHAGVLPLFARRLALLPEAAPPPAIKSRLQDLYQRNGLRNLHLARLLVQVVELLNQNGIQSLSYKGPATSLQAYGDLSFRQFNDLDLLIHPQDFLRVYPLLLGAGFIPFTPLTPTQQSLLVKTAIEFTFQYRSDLLEIHWGIALPDYLHPLHTAAFWEDVQPIAVLNRPILTLSPEKAVFFTCFHATKHAWESLRWVADLAHYAHSYPHLDWLALLDFARQNGFHRLICLSLLLAERLAGVSFSPSVSLRLASEPRASLLAQEIIERISASQEPASTVSRLYFFFHSRERLRDRLYMFLAQLFVPREVDWRTISLPASLFPLYYILRPMRIFIKLILSFTSRIFNEET